MANDTQRGRFITFEGGEGAGKTTQITRLIEALTAHQIAAIATREPGGTPAAEDIRALLVRGSTDRWAPLSEALLLNAARVDHLERLIRPSLANGQWVISDRFADSTTAYQGHALGLGTQTTSDLEQLVVGDTQPDLTLILDLPVDVGLARARAREADANAGEDRYEGFDVAFHETLRQAFLDIAKGDPDRCIVIDATQSPDEVAQAIWQAVITRFGEVTS
ncbi:dTMP kinase [Pyruvatibacter sp.]|uniref:dTMP kinase n=1 Tax=Pyruvatibacter sp. TaxID=1981328 RepID=UPI003266574D